MEKTPRYTQRERNMVLGFAAQYRDVIENKRTDAESNRKKDEVWRVIAKEFNSRVYHQRTSKQLRQLYKNMKLLLKKDLCSDGKPTKSFVEILATLSQQNTISQLISSTAAGGSEVLPCNNRQGFRMDCDDKSNLMSSFDHSHMDNGIVLIKSEELSDNEQSSLRNGCDGMDDDDDCLSTKDIPEVCLEEDDEEIFTRAHNSSDSILSIPNGKCHNSPDSPSNKSDFLLALAIEERKRKIELLNAQIEYWKTLTKKLESNNSGIDNSNSTNTSPSCHCHLSPRINGVNQS